MDSIEEFLVAMNEMKGPVYKFNLVPSDFLIYSGFHKYSKGLDFKPKEDVLKNKSSSPVLTSSDDNEDLDDIDDIFFHSLPISSSSENDR